MIVTTSASALWRRPQSPSDARSCPHRRTVSAEDNARAGIATTPAHGAFSAAGAAIRGTSLSANPVETL